MRKTLLALLLILPTVSMASTDSIRLINSVTNQEEVIEAESIYDANRYYSFLPQIEGVKEIYEAYVENGYRPMDAMLFTNWDMLIGLQAHVPDFDENGPMRADIELIKAKYKAAAD